MWTIPKQAGTPGNHQNQPELRLKVAPFPLIGILMLSQISFRGLGFRVLGFGFRL